MAETKESYFILEGKTDLNDKNEEEIKALLQKQLTDAWKTDVEVTTMMQDVYPEDVGVTGVNQICILLKLKGENIQRKKHKLSSGSTVTCIQEEEQVSLCEFKVESKYVDVIPNFDELLFNQITTLGIKILKDQDGEYWLSGQWFQVAVAKRNILTSYKDNNFKYQMECCQEISKNQNTCKALEMLLSGTLSKSNMKSGSTTVVYRTRQSLIHCALAVATNYKKIMDRLTSMWLENTEHDDVVTVCLKASTKKACEDSIEKLRATIHTISEKHDQFILPCEAPAEYNLLLNDILQDKFHPTLTIIIGNGRNIIYGVSIAEKVKIQDFVTRYTTCVKPSPNCGSNIMDKLAQPKLMKTIQGENLENKTQPDETNTMESEDTTVTKDLNINHQSHQLEFMAMFVSTEHQIKYLKFTHKGDIESLAKGTECTVKFEQDDSGIYFEGKNKDCVVDALNSVKQLCAQNSLVTKELPYGLVENIQDDKILIIHCDDSTNTTVTGPKEVVEKLESIMKYDSRNVNYESSNVTQAQREPVTRSSSYDGASSVSGPPSKTNDTRKKRVRKLITTGSETQHNYEDTESNPTSPDMDQVFGSSPILPAGATVYKHNKTGVSIEVGIGDITKLKVDAIVNAANGLLKHEGGVAYVIAKGAGPELDRECEQLVRHWPLKTGETCKTTAGHLPCKMVIHAVGPAYHDYRFKGECLEMLKKTFERCLADAVKYNITSIAIPALCSGIYGVPQEKVASMAQLATIDFLGSYYGNTLKTICFTDINANMIQLFNKELDADVHKGILDVSKSEGSAV